MQCSRHRADAAPPTWSRAHARLALRSTVSAPTGRGRERGPSGGVSRLREGLSAAPPDPSGDHPMQLLTKPLLDQLIKNGQMQAKVKGTDREHDLVPVVKLFDPFGAGTWLLTEIEPN